MSKIVAFIGSPNKNGKTATLVKEIVRSAEESGATAKIYALNDMNIKYCQACMYCKNKGDTCCMQDDMQEVYKDFKEADAIVIGSPIYSYQVSAQTKTLLDRFYALFDADFNPRFGSKKTVIVYSQGFADQNAFQSYFDLNTRLFTNFGYNIIDTLVFAGYEESKKEELMTRASELGTQLS